MMGVWLWEMRGDFTPAGRGLGVGEDKKPYEIDPVRDAVARYLVQRGPALQNLES